MFIQYFSFPSPASESNLFNIKAKTIIKSRRTTAKKNNKRKRHLKNCFNNYIARTYTYRNFYHGTASFVNWFCGLVACCVIFYHILPTVLLIVLLSGVWWCWCRRTKRTFGRGLSFLTPMPVSNSEWLTTNTVISTQRKKTPDPNNWLELRPFNAL